MGAERLTEVTGTAVTILEAISHLATLRRTRTTATVVLAVNGGRLFMLNPGTFRCADEGEMRFADDTGLDHEPRRIGDLQELGKALELAIERSRKAPALAFETYFVNVVSSVCYQLSFRDFRDLQQELNSAA